MRCCVDGRYQSIVRRPTGLFWCDNCRQHRDKEDSEERFDSGPIHDGIDLIHSFDSSVLFYGREEGDVSEGEAALHFLEAHNPSQRHGFGGNISEESLFVNYNQYVAFE